MKIKKILAQSRKMEKEVETEKDGILNDLQKVSKSTLCNRDGINSALTTSLHIPSIFNIATH